MNKLKLLLGALAFYGRFFCSFTAIGFHVRRLFWRRFQPDTLFPYTTLFRFRKSVV